MHRLDLPPEQADPALAPGLEQVHAELLGAQKAAAAHVQRAGEARRVVGEVARHRALADQQVAAVVHAVEAVER